ncbi:MAG TPA: hypothetical protein VFW39_03600 [Sphingomicrobium sp.]|nr:hypothetical protein [Sphingomicrobium sp.]
MRKCLIPLLVAGAALAVGSPALAQRSAAPAPARTYHRSPLEMALSARLDSIRNRIELLREEGLMGSEEARDLRQQSRIIEERLIGLTARDAADVELAISRIQQRVRGASDDALWDHAFARGDEDRFNDRHAYEMHRPDAFEQMDRHIAPPVDRWDDPFDRGDEF